MTDEDQARTLEAAVHWERLADEAEKQASWDREHGIDLCAPGQSPGDNKARGYRLVARTLHLEAATGLPHCICHERPVKDCPVRIARARGAL